MIEINGSIKYIMTRKERVLKNLIILTLVLLINACQKQSRIILAPVNSASSILGVYMAGYNHNPYASLSNKLNEKHSFFLGGLKKYGFNKKIENLKKGQYILASIQVKSSEVSGQFVCSIQQNDFKNSIRRIPKVSKIGWQTLEIEQYINSDSVRLHFYAFAVDDSVQFRNLRIRIYDSVPRPMQKDKLTPFLKLYIPEKGKLDSLALSAIQEGVISKNHKEEVKAFILKGSDSITVKIRLKGDWTDHLSSGKESYRIKIKDESAFEGLRTFSIHHPKTRHFMHEWFMHKLCRNENLLTTKYEFIQVELNGTYKGVYAIEEHFEKQLIESSRRREAPILKFDESGTWALTILQKKIKNKLMLPVFQSSVVSVFKKSKTIENSLLKNNYIQGAKLVEQFKNLHKNIEEIIDVENTAKYFALLELGNVEHGHQWHNMRFYFNPISQKIEFIGFDMNPGMNEASELYLKKVLDSEGGPKELHLIQPFLKNASFKKHYLFYLRRFTDETYLETVFTSLSVEMGQIENLLRYEIPNYQFDKSFYNRRAVVIRSKINDLDSLWEIKIIKKKNLKNFVSERIYTRQDTLPYLKEISINAYVDQIDLNDYELEICNFMRKPIAIVGFEDEQKNSVFFDKPILFEYYDGQEKCKTIPIKTPPKKILFTEVGNPEVIRKKNVLQWPKPEGLIVRTELKNSFSSRSPYYTVSNSTLTFNSGHLVISELIYIPEYYNVVINEGTTIDLRKAGGIIFTNSISINGSANHKVRIMSTDSTNNGLTVLKGENVFFSNVEFDNLRSLNFKGWILSGGINIYDSSVRINNCSIRNSLAEDAINLISSNFEIDNLEVENVASDGLDSDFCKGILTNSHFINIGNDGIDFSGSKVELKKIGINNCGDKGVSCGEASNIDIDSVDIFNCEIGLAVKDGSIVYYTNSAMRRVNIGFAVFNKKPEYKKPTLFIKRLNYFNAILPLIIDYKCVVQYNDFPYTFLKSI